MHFFIDNRPVYRDREIQKSFDNSLYFYSKFINNCPICLSYQEEPCIIPCGHSFCKDCLQRLTEFSSRCPVCDAFFWASKPVKFFFFEQITLNITFRRLESMEIESTDGRGFFEYPYCYCYYDSMDTADPVGTDTTSSTDNIALQKLAIQPKAQAPSIALCGFQGRADGKGKASDAQGKGPQSFTFYQSADGQLYFLHPRTYKNYKTFPEFIFGRIKDVYTCYGKEHKHPELQHIPHNYTINIVTIH